MAVTVPELVTTPEMEIECAITNPRILNVSEMFNCPGIQALQQTNPLLFKTLQVFSYGTVKDLPKEVDLPPAALSKLRQLSLISLAANSSSNRQLPYAEVMQFLELSATRELEDIVIDAIYNKLIKARLDSKGQFVEVDDWASRDTPLEAIPDIIDMFQQFSHRVADVRQSALQDADRRDAQVLADLKRAQQVEADLVAARKAHDESMLVSLNSHEPSTSTRSKASRITRVGNGLFTVYISTGSSSYLSQIHSAVRIQNPTAAVGGVPGPDSLSNLPSKTTSTRSQRQ
ncbi:hypothetical protein Q1695_009278 [Nippostrongylus brasiliensis]|nr:hypothetical protein Q1695_009278 [Nippostrongylus brasiliensis]